MKLSAALGVTISYLLGMDGNTMIISAARSKSRNVLIVRRVAAGAANKAIEQSDRTRPLPNGVYDEGSDLVWLEVSGNSTNRVIPDGALVLVDKSAEA